MEWNIVLIAVVASIGLLLGWILLARSRRGIRTGTQVEVVFELQLPSEWGAELTRQLLENQEIRSELAKDGKRWLCRVVRPMGFDLGKIQQLCKRLNQIAVARGGGCVTHTVKAGSRVEVYHH